MGQLGVHERSNGNTYRVVAICQSVVRPLWYGAVDASVPLPWWVAAVSGDEVTNVEGLRLIAWSLEGGNVKMADECRRAADEIERLRAWAILQDAADDEQLAEIERLRAAGDALAHALGLVQRDRPSAHTDHVWAVIGDALSAYEEARRER